MIITFFHIISMIEKANNIPKKADTLKIFGTYLKVSIYSFMILYCLLDTTYYLFPFIILNIELSGQYISIHLQVGYC